MHTPLTATASAATALRDTGAPLPHAGDWFAGNAFHRLGLPGDASAQQIAEAAAALQAAVQAGTVPASPWDGYWSAPPCRTAAALREAAALLGKPVDRLLHRLFWFQQGRDVLRQLSPASLPIVASDWAHAADPRRRHDGALLCLIRAQAWDPALRYESRWMQALEYWQRLLASDDYWADFAAIEAAGAHAPSAGPELLQQIRQQAMDFILDTLMQTIECAHAVNDRALFARGRRIIRNLHLSAGLSARIDGKAGENSKG
ncbi:MAG: hypothetical protein ACYDCO_15255 [Armatimonadota bacterium]